MVTRARFPCDSRCQKGCVCSGVDTPRGRISSRELRWIAAALIVFWLVLIFGLPALLNWLLPRLAA